MPVHLHYHNPNCGVTVVSMPPQRRTLYSYSYSVTGCPLDLNNRSPYRVWLPHVVLVCGYTRVPGGFCWKGYYDEVNYSSLFFAREPIRSAWTLLDQAPTEFAGGKMCLEHAWDGVVFATPRLMIGTIMGLWLSHNHKTPCIGYSKLFWEKWSRMSRDEVLSCPLVVGRVTKTLAPFLPPGATLIDKPLGALPTQAFP